MPAANQIPAFFIPLSRVDSIHSAGDFDVGPGFQSSDRFVGDQANSSLKYLSDPWQIMHSDWPLVLFGPSGTGKTAIGLSVISKLAARSNKKATVLSADGFRRRFASSIDTDSIDMFRNNLACSAALYIDNIHELAKYEAAQIELAGIIDTLIPRRIPLVFTIDDRSLMSGSLSHRVSSRLSSGLCLSVNAPGKIARRILIGEAAQSFGLELTENALNHLTDKLAVTCPRIHAFFASFVNWLSTTAMESDSNPVHCSLIVDFLASRKVSDWRMTDAIIREVARTYKLKVSDIKSNSRKQSIVLARGVAIYLLRDLLHISFSKIGELFGGRDHSTVMHAVNRIQSLIDKQENDLVNSIDAIKQSILEYSILDIETIC